MCEGKWQVPPRFARFLQKASYSALESYTHYLPHLDTFSHYLGLLLPITFLLLLGAIVSSFLLLIIYFKIKLHTLWQTSTAGTLFV